MHIKKSELKRLVATSKSFREVARKAGHPNNHCQIKKLVERANIDFAHFQHGKVYDSMVGQKYGMLKVIAIEKQNDKRRRVIATCECECGKNKDIRCDQLKDGIYVSCGCHSKNRWNTVLDKNHSFSGIGKLGSSLFKQMKRCAERRSIPFELTIEQAWKQFQKQENKCALTGVELSFGRVRHHHETTASLDRIDSEKGYRPDNVQWVLKDVNMIKGKYNNEYFIQLCNIVAKNHPRA